VKPARPRVLQRQKPKSERLTRLDPDQLSLALEDLEQAIAKAEAFAEKTQVPDAPADQPRRAARAFAAHS